jgi:arsenite-transporting ATPase
MVVTPERMVIDETRRAWTELSLFELGCDAVVMNRLLPDAALSEDFFADWGRLQGERLHEVEELFAPLPVLSAPLQDDEVTGLARLAAHGEELFGARAPDAILSPPQRVKFERQAGDYLVRIPLPEADPAALDVAKVDDELVVRAGPLRRTLALPRRMAPLALLEARLDEGWLCVRLGQQPDAAAAPR